MKKTTIVPLALTFAALWAGCGGGEESDEDKIKSAIKDSYSAFAEGNSGEFCQKLTADYRADFEEYYEGKCDDATVKKVLAQVSGPDKQKLTEPQIGAIKMEGKTAAYVDVNGDGLEMQKEGDDWKLDDFDVPGGS